MVHMHELHVHVYIVQDSVQAKVRKRGAPPLYKCHALSIITQDDMSMRTVVFHASHVLIRSWLMAVRKRLCSSASALMSNIAIKISWISFCGSFRVGLGFNQYQSDLSLWWQYWTSLRKCRQACKEGQAQTRLWFYLADRLPMACSCLRERWGWWEYCHWCFMLAL